MITQNVRMLNQTRRYIKHARRELVNITYDLQNKNYYGCRRQNSRTYPMNAIRDDD